VKQDADLDHFGLIHQLDAAIADHLIKALDSIEASIDEQLVRLD
jgi:hypothetical protein